ncbi:hypothetical protein GO988_21655 [Hymenobacter sp. HMF4947]|uniref:Uncharacterized protein n=1 Tax=Hymenobacter ginkgonis TaxID=2682976 RepID=A0A7K1TKK4_9BACT|nr:hypothetical protein [Hymenobacter ginkgonis]MVN78944.1 hypothetical protein [Hymenobacter ginkgonis]
MKNNQAPPKMRQLMPEGFLGTLADRTGCTSIPDLSQIVLRERVKSKYWPAVLALAEATNPQGYAAWAQANPDKLPAVAQAA